jgi:serine/threonine-protein kinase HipA
VVQGQARHGRTGKNRHYALRDIQRQHFNAMAPRCSYGRDAEPIIERLIAQTPAVIERVSREQPEGFPAKVSDRIFDGLRKAVAALDAMPARLDA